MASRSPAIGTFMASSSNPSGMLPILFSSDTDGSAPLISAIALPGWGKTRSARPMTAKRFLYSPKNTLPWAWNSLMSFCEAILSLGKRKTYSLGKSPRIPHPGSTIIGARGATRHKDMTNQFARCDLMKERGIFGNYIIITSLKLNNCRISHCVINLHLEIPIYRIRILGEELCVAPRQVITCCLETEWERIKGIAARGRDRQRSEELRRRTTNE